MILVLEGKKEVEIYGAKYSLSDMNRLNEIKHLEFVETPDKRINNIPRLADKQHSTNSYG